VYLSDVFRSNLTKSLRARRVPIMLLLRPTCIRCACLGVLLWCSFRSCSLLLEAAWGGERTVKTRIVVPKTNVAVQYFTWGISRVLWTNKLYVYRALTKKGQRKGPTRKGGQPASQGNKWQLLRTQSLFTVLLLRALLPFCRLSFVRLVLFSHLSL